MMVNCAARRMFSSYHRIGRQPLPSSFLSHAALRVFSSQNRGRQTLPSSFLSNARRRNSRQRGGGGGTTSGIPPYVWFPVVGLTGTLLYGYYAFLDRAPLTNRKRWIATSAEWERQMGDQEYRQLLQQFRGKVLPPQHRASQTVHRVGGRLVEATKTFSQQHPSANVSPSPYTFSVIRSDTANAFVLPNNHVFVLTGLFQYVTTEDELAAVLGHEMAHNLARHAGEKISGGLVVNIMARLLFLVDPSGFMSSLLLPAATLLHSLPNSRQAESEADEIGLFLAAQACYDPRAAKRVFAAMKEGTTATSNSNRNGQKQQQRQPPEFMSTHPSHDRRIRDFDEWMPKAMMLYESDGGARCRQVRQDMAAARLVAAQGYAQQEQEAQRQYYY